MPGTGAVVSKVLTQEALCLLEKKPQPCGIIIFGASGDLTHRKLMPSLQGLAKDSLLPKNFYVLGVARSSLTDQAFRDKIKEGLTGAASPAGYEDFLSHCTYLAGDYNNPQTYKAIQERMNGLDKVYQTQGRHLFYLSTPPSLYEPVVQQLGAAGLAVSRDADGWVRIVIEKPFGYSQASAEKLNETIHSAFQEKQVYRIDHYLGKETVQNILMFRFANAMFEPIWNYKYIDHVQITAAESVGVEHRAGYYERSGVLRDMFQNHLFQLMSLVAMEPPASFEADAVRDEKAKVMAALCGVDGAKSSDIAVRGQYTEGSVEGETVPAYRKEPDVNPQSTTDTFAALRVEVENWRWRGVPFYLRSGKRLPRRVTEIAVEFKHVPTSIFKPLMAEQIASNVLNFRIQPNEGISLCFQAKHPGPKLCMSSVTMHFDYEEAFGVKPPEAYARLFMDVMLGDQTLFARHDWLSLSWQFLDPILDQWAAQKEKGLNFYPAGTWGPPAADELLKREGRQWLTT